MNISPEIVSLLLASGRSFQITPEGGLVVNGAPEAEAPRSAGARRMARYRERRRGLTEAAGAGEPLLTVTPASPPVTEASQPSPDVTSPSPSSPSSTPPTPAPPPEPPPARTRESAACAGVSKPSKRREREAEAAEANAVPLPANFDTPAFRTAWQEWCAHRTRLAALHPGKPWTAAAARHTLADCARFGPDLAVQAIQQAVANGWQGLVWQRLAKSTPKGAPQPRPPRTGSLNRPDRYAAPTAPSPPRVRSLPRVF